jgi:hypothetical protein
MAPIARKRSRAEDQDEITAVESASSSLRHDAVSCLSQLHGSRSVVLWLFSITHAISSHVRKRVFQ